MSMRERRTPWTFAVAAIARPITRRRGRALAAQRPPRAGPIRAPYASVERQQVEGGLDQSEPVCAAPPLVLICRDEHPEIKLAATAR